MTVEQVLRSTAQGHQWLLYLPIRDESSSHFRGPQSRSRLSARCKQKRRPDLLGGSVVDDSASSMYLHATRMCCGVDPWFHRE